MDILDVAVSKMAQTKATGELHLKMGGMYAEKTTVLIRDLLREKASGLRVAYFNYSEDTRNSEDVYSTHNPVLVKNISSLEQFPLFRVQLLAPIKLVADNFDVFGFDEAQFYPDLYEVVTYLVEECSKIVYVVGLDADKNRNKFGQLLDLIPMADSYEKLYARCMRCAEKGVRTKAIHTLCKIPSMEQKKIGAKDIYEAVCRKCYREAHSQ